MKKLLLFPVMVILSLLMLQPYNVSAETYVNQADIDKIDAVYTAEEALATELGRDDSTIEDIDAAAESLAGALDGLISHSFNSTLSDTYLKASRDVVDSAVALRAVVGGTHAALTSAEQSTIDDYYNKYNQAIDNYVVSNEKFNASVDSTNTANVTGFGSDGTARSYLILLASTSVLSIGSFIWAFAMNKAPATVSRRGVALASLWPLLGAVVTYLTFVFADQMGGTYYMMYGPVLFGFFAYLNEVSKYNSARRAVPSS